MKTIAIVDIDDKLLEEFEDFAIECNLIATSKEDKLWRNGVRYVGEIELIPFDKHTLKKAGKDFVIYERNYLFANIDREYELNKSLKKRLEKGMEGIIEKLYKANKEEKK